jgi:hypothetical protein
LTAAIKVMSGIRIRRGVIRLLYSNECSMKPGGRGQGKPSQLLDLAAAASLAWAKQHADRVN